MGIKGIWLISILEFYTNIKSMKKLVLTVSFVLTAFVAFAQCGKVESDGRTLRSSSNSLMGKIDSDGATIRNANNSMLGKVDSDKKHIRNSNNSLVLVIDGSTLRNANNGSIGSMSDVSRSIGVSNPSPAQVALWWFLCKN